MKDTSILVIYTGGTIGMKQDPDDLALRPFNFEQIVEEVPELRKFGCRIDTFTFDPIIDSSDVDVDFWKRLAGIIEEKYAEYDGFVILHGTDTMSYSASALSFMLEDLEKPVIFTGSQLPIGMPRTDGKENLISAIEIACAKDGNGNAKVPEVCIFFDSALMRGNRTTKYSAEEFKAFISPNYPTLAEAGINIKYHDPFIYRPQEWGKRLKVHKDLDPRAVILKIYPGIAPGTMESILGMPRLRGVVLETFGSGNAPSSEWFIDSIRKASGRGLVIVNVTQCMTGSVNMGVYATGIGLKSAGVLNGYDSTTESALAKLFFLMGQYPDNKRVKCEFEKNLRGEISK